MILVVLCGLFVFAMFLAACVVPSTGFRVFFGLTALAMVTVTAVVMYVLGHMKGQFG